MNHPINYCNLYEGRRFTLRNDRTVYVKIANSHAVNERTKEDAILGLSDKCFPCGNNRRLFNEITDIETLLFAGVS